MLQLLRFRFATQITMPVRVIVVANMCSMTGCSPHAEIRRSGLSEFIQISDQWPEMLAQFGLLARGDALLRPELVRSTLKPRDSKTTVSAWYTITVRPNSASNGKDTVLGARLLTYSVSDTSCLAWDDIDKVVQNTFIRPISYTLPPPLKAWNVGHTEKVSLNLTASPSKQNCVEMIALTLENKD